MTAQGIFICRLLSAVRKEPKLRTVALENASNKPRNEREYNYHEEMESIRIGGMKDAGGRDVGNDYRIQGPNPKIRA